RGSPAADALSVLMRPLFGEGNATEYARNAGRAYDGGMQVQSAVPTPPLVQVEEPDGFIGEAYYRHEKVLRSEYQARSTTRQRRLEAEAAEEHHGRFALILVDLSLDEAAP